MTEITLLDGGMGQELINRSGDAPTPLWATRVMMDHPGLVGQIHADYFRAGASIATVAPTVFPNSACPSGDS